MRKTSLILSILLIFISIILYNIKNHYWYYPAVIGAWLLFDYLSHLYKNKTTLDLLIKKQYKRFIKVYIALSFFGILIEIGGIKLLKFWSYTYLTPLILIISVPILYPFILMSFREMYNFIHSLVKNNFLSVILSMILGIIIWEVPNIYSQDWIYKIPYITFEIFHINIIIIFSWVILILGPIYIYKLLKI